MSGLEPVLYGVRNSTVLTPYAPVYYGVERERERKRTRTRTRTSTTMGWDRLPIGICQTLLRSIIPNRLPSYPLPQPGTTRTTRLVRPVSAIDHRWSGYLECLVDRYRYRSSSQPATDILYRYCALQSRSHAHTDRHTDTDTHTHTHTLHPKTTIHHTFPFTRLCSTLLL